MLENENKLISESISDEKVKIEKKRFSYKASSKLYGPLPKPRRVS